MVSLAELRARNVTPIWQEAVAVIQELIQTVKATTGSAELLPDLGHVALIPNGDVVALPGSPEPAVPVRHAAVMLKLLVDGIPVPPELDQFIERNVAEPPQYDSVAEFSRNLAFFERPGRRSDVERLVGRAVAAEQTSRAEEELRRLKERANEVTQVMPAPEFLQQQQKRGQMLPIAIVAGLGVVILASGLWLWQRARAPQAPAAAATVEPGAGAPAAENTPAEGTPAASAPGAAAPAGAPPAAPSATATTPPASASGAPGGTPGAPIAGSATNAAPARRSLIERAGDAVRTAVNSLMGTTPAPAPATPPPAVAEKAPPAKPRQNRRPPASQSVKPVPPPEQAAPAAAAEPPAPPAVVTSAAVMPAPPEEPLEEAPISVFTAADPTVTPPVIVRPVLPRDPPPNVPPENIGTIEVVVDEQGDVLNVRLISPANRFHERMLVSAAKMWKFRPAYKDGQPVRYRTRVRLTI